MYRLDSLFLFPFYNQRAEIKINIKKPLFSLCIKSQSKKLLLFIDVYNAPLSRGLYERDPGKSRERDVAREICYSISPC
jgi:hypothetical protein